MRPPALPPLLARRPARVRPIRRGALRAATVSPRPDAASRPSIHVPAGRRHCRRPWAQLSPARRAEVDVYRIGLRRDRELDLLHRRAIGDSAVLPSDRGDGPGQLDVPCLEPPQVAGQPNRESTLHDRELRNLPDPGSPRSLSARRAPRMDGMRKVAPPCNSSPNRRHRSRQGIPSSPARSYAAGYARPLTRPPSPERRTRK